MTFKLLKYDYHIFKWSTKEERWFRRKKFLSRKYIENLRERVKFMEELVGQKLTFIGHDGGFLYEGEDGQGLVVHHPSLETISIRRGERPSHSLDYHDSYFEVFECNAKGHSIRRVMRGSDAGREFTETREEEEARENPVTLQSEKTEFYNPLLD